MNEQPSHDAPDEPEGEAKDFQSFRDVTIGVEYARAFHAATVWVHLDEHGEINGPLEAEDFLVITANCDPELQLLRILGIPTLEAAPDAQGHYLFTAFLPDGSDEWVVAGKEGSYEVQLKIATALLEAFGKEHGLDLSDETPKLPPWTLSRYLAREGCGWPGSSIPTPTLPMQEMSELPQLWCAPLGCRVLGLEWLPSELEMRVWALDPERCEPVALIEYCEGIDADIRDIIVIRVPAPPDRIGEPVMVLSYCESGDGQMGAWKTSEPAELIQDGYLFGALELPKTFLRAV